MSKAERLPLRAQRRLTAEQREAYDRLRWYRPGPADRARLKMVLGWKRTRDETIALALDLLGQGLLEQVVADRIGVSDRYLRRMLVEESLPPDFTALDPSGHAAEVAPTCEPDTGVPPRRPGRSPVRFASFRELDEWLA